MALTTQSAGASGGGAYALDPAAGQFIPIGGTLILSQSISAAPSTFTPSVTSANGMATGVPADATSVVLEYNVTGSSSDLGPNFAGYLSAGDTSADAVTAMRFPVGMERNDFDVVPVNSDGTASITVNQNGSASGYSPVANPTGKLIVRLHGYYTGSADRAGSTYVGYAPEQTFSQSISLDNPSTAVQLTGIGKLPSDGSVTAVAVQINVQSPGCDGEVAVVPDGSPRTDRDASFTAGDNFTNFDLVQPAANGRIDVKLWDKGNCGQSGHTATILIRDRGYFTDPTFATAGSSYGATSPNGSRLVDTTSNIGLGLCGSGALNGTTGTDDLKPNQGCSVQVTGQAGVPTSGVSGVALDVMAMNVPSAATGSIKITDSAADQSSATSTVTYNGDSQASNFEMATYASLTSTGQLYFYNSGGSAVDVVVRVRGYYETPSTPEVARTVGVDDSGTQLSWSPPASDGGAAITNYVVSVTDENTASVQTATVSPIQSVYTFNQVNPNDTNDFSIQAINSVGTGNVTTPDETADDLRGCVDDTMVSSSYVESDGTMTATYDGSSSTGIDQTFETQEGTTYDVLAPPATFDADTATPAQLTAYDIPPKPTDPGAAADWESAFGGGIKWQSGPDCESLDVVHKTKPYTIRQAGHFWAGLEAFPGTGSVSAFTNVSATVTVPKASASCPHASSHAMWVGLGGDATYTGGDTRLLQNGIMSSTGLHDYHAWWEEITPSYTGGSHTMKQVQVKEGDSVYMQTYYHDGQAQEYVIDTTQASGKIHRDKSATQAYSGTTADWVDEAPEYVQANPAHPEDGKWYYLRHTTPTVFRDPVAGDHSNIHQMSFYNAQLDTLQNNAELNAGDPPSTGREVPSLDRSSNKLTDTWHGC